MTHGTWREALGLLRPWLMLRQLALALIVFVCAVLWLRIPDSGGLLLVLTCLIGLAIVCLACGGEAAILLRLGGRPRTRWMLLRSAALVLAFLIAHHVWTSWCDTRLLDDDRLSRWANYFVSRLPHTLRYVLTAGRLLTTLQFVMNMIEWVGEALLAALLLVPAMAGHAVAAMTRVLASLRYWTTSLLVLWFTGWLSAKVMNWTPGHSLKGQLLSLALRLGFVVLADTLLVCFALATMAALVRRSEADHTPAGTPEDSHPRTTDIP